MITADTPSYTVKAGTRNMWYTNGEPARVRGYAVYRNGIRVSIVFETKAAALRCASILSRQENK